MKIPIWTFALVTSSIVMVMLMRAQAIGLPSRGTDPSIISLIRQQVINNATFDSALVLPAGVCVVVKSEIAPGAV